MIDILPYLLLTSVGCFMLIVWMLWYGYRPSDMAIKPLFSEDLMQFGKDAKYYNSLKSVSMSFKGLMLYNRNPVYKNYGQVYNGRKIKPNFKVEE